MRVKLQWAKRSHGGHRSPHNKQLELSTKLKKPEPITLQLPYNPSENSNNSGKRSQHTSRLTGHKQAGTQKQRNREAPATSAQPSRSHFSQQNDHMILNKLI